MSNSKKLLTTALAIATIAAASFAGAGQAFAHGKGGKRFFVRSAIFYSAAPAYVSCWKWIGGKKVWVCY